MAYDNRYRSRVIEYIVEGHTQKEASKTFKVGTATISRWLDSYRKTGTAGGGYTDPPRSPRKIEPDKLVAYMAKHPDAFLKEVAQEFSCCVEAVRKALERNGITLKKRHRTTKSAKMTNGARIRRQ